jgi:hypothetical protein
MPVPCKKLASEIINPADPYVTPTGFPFMASTGALRSQSETLWQGRQERAANGWVAIQWRAMSRRDATHTRS